MLIFIYENIEMCKITVARYVIPRNVDSNFEKMRYNLDTIVIHRHALRFIILLNTISTKTFQKLSTSTILFKID